MAIVRELVTLLRYQVDRSGLTEYAQKAQTVGRQVGGIGRAAMQGWREGVRNALNEYGLVPGKVWQGIREQRRLNREQRQSVQNVREIGGGYSMLGSYIRAALAGVGVVAVAQLADEWSGVQARIGLATDSVDEQRIAMERLYATAQSSGQDFLATGDLFTSISRNRKELGLALDDSLQLTDTIGKLLTIGGGSAAGQQAALTQLGQALGSGTLRGDELNSILEQAPRLAQAVADSFGVSVGQLRALGEEGKITSKALADGLLKLGASINEEFDRMPKTFGRGMTLIRNAWGRFINQMNRATAASESFYVVARLIAENMAEIVRIGAMALLAAGVMRLLPLLKAMRGASMAALWPFLRMYTILESIRLIGDDVLTWLHGGESVLGTIIGRSEAWKTQVDAVKGFLASIKDALGGASESLGEWLSKWGTIGTVIAGVALLIGWIPTAIGVVALILIRYWGDIRQAGEDLWDAFTEGAAQSWTEIKSDFQRLLDWFKEQGAWLKSLFAGMVPDWLSNGVSRVGDFFGVRPSTMQRGGSAPISTTDNRRTEIIINGVAGNPATVGKAAEQGVNRGFGPAVPVVPPGFLTPNVEAMP
ncbi:tape measure protein [Paracandidimonas lactea]|uniref:tape measure protein n=1 Tax=Paracandidimonas lactea TaxID=2895524 RepID=UPI001F18C55E|nr:tape measure protein [Paracandidimonas lactea]